MPVSPQKYTQQTSGGLPVSRETTDPELDALLGRLEPTLLSAGFAERVIQSVHPAEAVPATGEASSIRALRAFRTMGVAASFACCFALAWWAVSPSDTRPRFNATAPSEEELLLKALATLEISSGDLALVAQLGEVLEAELTERTSWLEKE
jgi:hypothetical protein